VKAHRLVSTIASALLAATATAQFGIVDQVSPAPPGTQFAGGDPMFVWQVQVRVGIAGELAGVELPLEGSSTASISVRIRIGDGWNTSPPAFQSAALKHFIGLEHVFVDATSAHLVFAVGDTFVIELQGNGTGTIIDGSYVDPMQAPALYPEPLFLNGPGCFNDCGWRIGFTSYVLDQTPPTAYCTAGTSSNGCVPSISATANPRVGHNSPCRIDVANVEGQRSGIVFYGSTPLITPWCASGGTSSLCVQVPLARTPLVNSGGTFGLCDGVLTRDWSAYQSANPGAPGAPWRIGEKVYVQGWFRDPASCRTSNLSNAIELTYQP
jgi:hypothetical protein